MKVANANNAIRISTGWATTKTDIDSFLTALKNIS
jgi:cysteine sulfinate desulfinase/cysteine desulfurase-like protein